MYTMFSVQKLLQVFDADAADQFKCQFLEKGKKKFSNILHQHIICQDLKVFL